MNADQIAKNLNLVAKDYMEGRISMGVHSQINRALWDLARELGLGSEVSNILNQSVIDEMSETEAQLKGS